MTIVDQPGEATDAFVVVINDLGQHSLWRAGVTVPPGWRSRSPALPRSQCLDVIGRSWRDMAPATARGGQCPDGGGLAHERFAEQAARRPEAVAVAAGRARMTYRELDESSSRLAHYLAGIGVGPETVAGVHLERGVDLIRVMLAVMKAGGAYLPLDPSLPAERLARVCAQVTPAVVITAAAPPTQGAPLQETLLQEGGARLLPLGGLAADLADQPPSGPAARPHPDNLCYVIYTSGSTGDPKAVAVSFGSLACVIGELAREYQITEDDRVAQVAAMAFDTSLEQVFTALTAGATLSLPPPGTMAPSELLRGIERKRISVIDLTPAYWHQVLAHTEAADQRLRSVRLMITGGDMASPADCRAARRAAPWARLLTPPHACRSSEREDRRRQPGPRGAGRPEAGQVFASA